MVKVVWLLLLCTNITLQEMISCELLWWHDLICLTDLHFECWIIDVHIHNVCQIQHAPLNPEISPEAAACVLKVRRHLAHSLYTVSCSLGSLFSKHQLGKLSQIHTGAANPGLFCCDWIIHHWVHEQDAAEETTPEHLGPLSRIYTPLEPEDKYKKQNTTDLCYPGHSLSQLLSSGRRCRALFAKTARHQISSFPTRRNTHQEMISFVCCFLNTHTHTEHPHCSLGTHLTLYCLFVDVRFHCPWEVHVTNNQSCVCVSID